MAGGAHLRIGLEHLCGVEAGAMRVEAASPNRGRSMTGEAVPLRVATHATLEVLTRSPAVAQKEELVRIVVTRLEDSLGGEARAGVTARAEAARVVAFAAVGLA